MKALTAFCFRFLITGGTMFKAGEELLVWVSNDEARKHQL